VVSIHVRKPFLTVGRVVHALLRSELDPMPLTIRPIADTLLFRVAGHQFTRYCWFCNTRSHSGSHELLPVVEMGVHLQGDGCVAVPENGCNVDRVKAVRDQPGGGGVPEIMQVTPASPASRAARSNPR